MNTVILNIGLPLALSLVLSLTLGSAPALAEPLNAQQQRDALELAHRLTWPIDNTSGTESNRPRPNHQLGLQTISIERDIIKNSTQPERVRVYQFNYDTDSARVVTVSLTEQKVIKQSLIPSVHLPLTPEEEQFALSTLSADTDAIAALKTDHKRRGRTPFSKLSELSVKSSIYKPLNKNHPCTEQRCALLSLFDNTNTVFAAEPIVNLSHSAVSWLNQ